MGGEFKGINQFIRGAEALLAWDKKLRSFSIQYAFW